MGKTGKWIKRLLKGKKEKDEDKKKVKEKVGEVSPVPAESRSTPSATTPKEKRRWSFRRSTGTKDVNSPDPVAITTVQSIEESENEQKKHAMAVAAAADAAAQAAAAMTQVTATACGRSSAIEEAAAIKIQAVFRSHLARKALCALKGLVKLQALVRGHLVRKQATATLRCMQALVTVQARARAQRIQMAEEEQSISQRQSIYRRSPQDSHQKSPLKGRFKQSYEVDRGMEENIKIVEMDLGEFRDNSRSRNSCSTPHTERSDHRFSTHSAGHRAHTKLDHQFQVSPAPSALTDMSPRACSGHFEEYSFTTAHSSPQYFSAVSKPETVRAPFTFPQPEYAESLSHEYPFFPNYMANTESSRAKARSQSAPKQRPDSYERQPSKRRPSLEGRNIPRGVRMQRSSSHVGATANGYQYPWSIKLDRSTVSLKESECGSTSTVLTNAYCRSLVAYEAQGTKY